MPSAQLVANNRNAERLSNSLSKRWRPRSVEYRCFRHRPDHDLEGRARHKRAERIESSTVDSLHLVASARSVGPTSTRLLPGNPATYPTRNTRRVAGKLADIQRRMLRRWMSPAPKDSHYPNQGFSAFAVVPSCAAMFSQASMYSLNAVSPRGSIYAFCE